MIFMVALMLLALLFGLVLPTLAVGIAVFKVVGVVVGGFVGVVVGVLLASAALLAFAWLSQQYFDWTPFMVWFVLGLAATIYVFNWYGGVLMLLGLWLDHYGRSSNWW